MSTKLFKPGAKHYFLSRLVLSTVLTLLSSFAFAVDYYVSEENGSESNDGLSAASPFKYVRTAAGKTAPGDTVYLLPGTYTNMGAKNAFDMLYVPNSGQAGAYITYSGVIDANGKRPLIKSSALTAVTLQTKSYVIVENLEIMAADTDHLDLQGTIGNWAWNSRSGIGVQTDSYNIIVRNCFIHDTPGGGIGVSGSDVVLVENNLVEHTSWGSTQGNSGISFYKMTEQANATRFAEWPDHDVIVYNNLSRYNVNLKGTQAFDYKLTDGNGIIIDDFKHTQGDESEAFEGSSLILGNISYGNGAAGINVFQTNNAEIYHNSVFDNGHSRRTSGDPVFELNHAHQPIQVGGAENVTVENNIFVRGDDSTSMISLFWNEDATISITNNLFWNNDGSVSTADVPAGNIVADPLFENAVALTQAQTDLLATASWNEDTDSAQLRLPTLNNNFPVQDLALNANSAARDAGVDTGYVTAVGSGVDLGAIENDTASTPLSNEVANIDAPSVFYTGRTSEILVDYTAVEDMDLVAVLQNSEDGNKNAGNVRVQVSAGEGVASLKLRPKHSVIAGDKYRLTVYMAPRAKFFRDRVDFKRLSDITLEKATITGLSSDKEFQKGSAGSVVVDYSTSIKADIVIILQDRDNGNSNSGVIRRTVNPGSGSVSLNLTPKNSAVPGSNYRIVSYITKEGGYWRDRYNQRYNSNRVLLDASNDAPDFDDVTSVSIVSPFMAGSTATLEVDYTTQQDGDLLIILVDGNDNWSWTSWARHPVTTGSAVQNFDINVPADAAKHSNYKLEVLLVETGGWNSSAVASWASSGNTVN